MKNTKLAPTSNSWISPKGTVTVKTSQTLFPNTCISSNITYWLQCAKILLDNFELCEEITHTPDQY